MEIELLMRRIEIHLKLIAQEEKNVDSKRAALVSLKGFDAKQMYETIKFENLSAFLKHYQIEYDMQFINSLLYRYSKYIGFYLSYENYLNFILPCEDDDLYSITLNKEHLGGAASIFSFKIRDAIRALFYSEIHYHFQVERSKKELFRDFEFKLNEYPLCQFKNIKKSQIELDEQYLDPLWRRINCMDKKLYSKSETKGRYFRELIFPEDLHQHLKILPQISIITEQALPQFDKGKDYAKNTRKTGYMECPLNDKCLFYSNIRNEKTYQSDKFIWEYQVKY